MASPLPTRKQSVDLSTSPGPRVSKIRRDPPPKIKEVTVEELRGSETRNAVIGVVLIALALVVILAAFSNYSGWTPRDYTAQV
jgi:hypothetical protein